MNICSKFECDNIQVKKVKNYGILMSKEDIGELYCCIPLTECMELSITDHVGTITGEYEILYREVLPRGKVGVIRLPKGYLSCDVILVK